MIWSPLLISYLALMLCQTLHAQGPGQSREQPVPFGNQLTITNEFVVRYKFQIVRFSNFFVQAEDIATGITRVHVRQGHTEQNRFKNIRVDVSHSVDSEDMTSLSLPGGLGLLVHLGQEYYESTYPSDIYEQGRTRLKSVLNNHSPLTPDYEEREISNHTIPFWLLIAVKKEAFIISYLQRGHSFFDLYNRQPTQVNISSSASCLLPDDMLPENTPYHCHKIKPRSIWRNYLPFLMSSRFSWRLVMTSEPDNGVINRVLRGIIFFYKGYRVVWAPLDTQQVFEYEQPSPPRRILRPSTPHPGFAVTSGPIEQVLCHPIAPPVQLLDTDSDTLASFSSAWDSTHDINSQNEESDSSGVASSMRVQCSGSPYQSDFLP